MARVSAGLLLYRWVAGALEVLLVHPGGPFWRSKDEGVWTIPKGELEEGEDALAAARREVEEETGMWPEGPFLELGTVRQKGGKEVRAWAAESDLDPDLRGTSTFQMEWPPRSGRIQEFPEIDRATFFSLEQAKRKIHPAQVAFLEELSRRLSSSR